MLSKTPSPPRLGELEESKTGRSHVRPRYEVLMKQKEKKLIRKGLISEVEEDGRSDVSSTSRSTNSLNHEIKLLRYVEPRMPPSAFQLASRTARIHEWNNTAKEREKSA